MQGPYTTAASSEKDLILVQPIDVLGKEHIGKVVIVDPDDDAQEEFLRQVAEALQQGGMRCVVVRGFGAYAVGANLDQAMANAPCLNIQCRFSCSHVKPISRSKHLGLDDRLRRNFQHLFAEFRVIDFRMELQPNRSPTSFSMPCTSQEGLLA